MWVDGTSTPLTTAEIEASTYTGAISAFEYGVRCDSSVDNAVALQAAIDAAAEGVSGSEGNTVLLPSGIIQIGAQIQVKSKVRLVGVGKRSTQITAIGDTFPINTPLIRLGDGTSIALDCRLEHLRVEASGIDGSTCVYSTEVQDGSGLESVYLSGYKVYGADFDGTDCAQFKLRNIETGANPSGGSTAAIRFFQSSGICSLDWLTANSQGTNTYGVLVDQCNVNITQIRVEGHTDGVYCSNDATCLISGAYGHVTTPNLVHFDVNTKRCIVMNAYNGASTNMIVDDFNFQTLTAAAHPSIPFYSQFDVLVGNQVGGISGFTDNALRSWTASTAGRLSASTAGQGAQIFDTTLNIPIWSDGTDWRDATGAVV